MALQLVQPTVDSTISTLYFWPHVKVIGLNITVVSPLLNYRVYLSITTPGHNLAATFNNKCRDNKEPCEREGITFIPLPVEILGGIELARRRMMPSIR